MYIYICTVYIYLYTRLGTNISPTNGTLEDEFSFPQVGYVSSLEYTLYTYNKIICPTLVKAFVYEP